MKGRSKMTGCAVMDFNEISMDEMYAIDGGSTKIAAAVLAIAGGVCFIVSGIASLCHANKVSAICNIGGGACEVAAGVCALIPAP